MKVLHLRATSQPALFEEVGAAPEGAALVSGDGDVRLWRGWLAREAADALLQEIRAAVAWTQERRKMYDRFVDVPRQHASQGDDKACAWTPRVLAVRRDLERLTGTAFSHVLFNRYRNGRDAVAWHNDHVGRIPHPAGPDTSALHGASDLKYIRRPVIASLSLGATRAFDLRPKSDRKRILSIELEHGDLIVMRGDTQEHWEHRVARDARVAGERINLTFRQQPE